MASNRQNFSSKGISERAIDYISEERENTANQNQQTKQTFIIVRVWTFQDGVNICVFETLEEYFFCKTMLLKIKTHSVFVKPYWAPFSIETMHIV